jgi:hypothetical protein
MYLGFHSSSSTDNGSIGKSSDSVKKSDTAHSSGSSGSSGSSSNHKDTTASSYSISHSGAKLKDNSSSHAKPITEKRSYLRLINQI